MSEKEETNSDLAKSNFLARMSHEMRTPLNAIIGMSTIAQTTDDLEKVAGCLTKINEASLHLLGMINDVLDMARIEAGKFILTKAEFNLARMLHKVTEAQKFMLDAKKQNLKLEYDPELPEIIAADEQRLAQVLENLLSNAIKFTPPEGTITLSLKKLKEDARHCILEAKVSDTGIGISEEGMNKIFALFEQADGGIARKYGGAGLGLRISSSIIRLMGGDIKVSSEPGKGAAFSFEVAVETGEENKAGLPSGAGKDGKGKLKFAGATLLLAEDVEINREIVLSILEDTGLAIECAGNGLEAVEKYRSSPKKYSIILMDIHMPDMDGLEATRQIRAFEKECGAPQVPIIAMTANVFRDDVEKCMAAGMSSHLAKPIDLKELMEQLESFLP